MKKSLLFAFYLHFICILFASKMMAQNPSYQIQGPHTEYKGPYYIRLYVNYVQSETNKWTEVAGVDLPNRTAATLANLNSVYNSFNIFFIGDPALGAPDYCTAPYQVLTQSNVALSNLHPNALDLFDLGDAGDPKGYAYFVPNNYFEISGKRGTTSAGQTEVVIHEVAHCLGLSHIFTGNGQGECMENNSFCADGVTSDSFCCGDFVADTPVSPQDITVSSDCSSSTSHPSLPAAAFRNFMSYSQPGQCRDLFTEGQVKRMWAYLALAPALQDMQMEPLTFSGATLPTVSGDIIVASGTELIVNSNLAMLPSSTIRVEPGASLVVSATITGACGGMWQGVVVDGSIGFPQIPIKQGKITLSNTGILEHANIAIDVQDNINGVPVPTTSGGIVNVLAGKLKDNTIGIRFEPYINVNGFSNVSKLQVARFSVTDNYRGGTKQPTFIDLTGIIGLNIWYCKFEDLRSNCITTVKSRAIGINAKSASFRVTNGAFTRLSTGIKVSELGETPGAFSVTGSHFSECFKGIHSLSTSKFTIRDNTFNIKNPSICSPLSNIEANHFMGVHLSGNTLGFTLSHNIFNFDGTTLPAEVLIGIHSEGLGEGLQNIIRLNSFNNLTIGNRAKGTNSGPFDGLLYLCNTNTNNFANPNPSPIDFNIASGKIKKDQGLKIGNAFAPTGNVFSGLGNTIVNDGESINYYFYEDGNVPEQDPTFGLGIGITGGVNDEPVTETFGNCEVVEPCNPCSEIAVSEWKTNFFQKRSAMVGQQAALLNTSSSTEQSILRSEISSNRLEMNKYGSQILRHYAQDTLAIAVDSIVRWLGVIHTYQTEINLARHYFFNTNYSAFNQVWGQIPSVYTLDQQRTLEYQRLSDLYALLQASLQNGENLGRLSESTINGVLNFASNCDESGYLSQAILLRNGISATSNCTETAPREQKSNMLSSKTENIAVFPNPTNESFTVVYAPPTERAKIQIFDLYGHLVYTENVSPDSKQVVINSSLFPSGVYLLEMSKETSSSDKVKILIVH
jgi:hypothetical protein